MTALFEDPATLSGEPAAAQRLRATMAAMRLSFAWFDVRKALSDEQKARAADAGGAEGAFLSAGRKLLDTRDPAFVERFGWKNDPTKARLPSPAP